MSDNECSVCYEKLNDTEYNVNTLSIKDPQCTIILKCGHKFHYDCIFMCYLKCKKILCPYCRQEGGLLPLPEGCKAHKFHNTIAKISSYSFLSKLIKDGFFTSEVDESCKDFAVVRGKILPVDYLLCMLRVLTTTDCDFTLLNLFTQQKCCGVILSGNKHNICENFAFDQNKIGFCLKHRTQMQALTTFFSLMFVYIHNHNDYFMLCNLDQLLDGKVSDKIFEDYPIKIPYKKQNTAYSKYDGHKRIVLSVLVNENWFKLFTNIFFPNKKCKKCGKKIYNCDFNDCIHKKYYNKIMKKLHKCVDDIYKFVIYNS